MDAFKTLLLGTPPTRTYTASATGLLTSANNLSDVADAATARTNIGLGNASNVTHATLTISGTTDSSSKDTGSIVTEGGLGVEKSATIGGNLTVSGGTASLSAPTGSVTVNYQTAGSAVGSVIVNPSSGELRTSMGPSVAWGGFHTWYTDTAERMRLTANGNLLLGGTTDISGSGGLKVFGTTAATSTTTGALQVAGGAGIAGAAFVGGNLTVSGTGTSSFAGTLQSNGGAGIGRIQATNTTSGTTTTDGLVLEQSGVNGYLWNYESGSVTIGANNAAVATFASAGVSIKGTTTNDNAATGYVGEYVSSTVSSGSAVSLTTGTAANVTSISLTAGDWDVNGIVAFDGAPTGTTLIAGISTTSATRAGWPTEAYSPSMPTASVAITLTPATRRLSLSGTTTVYLIAQGGFSAGSLAAYGHINARRVR